MASKTRDAASAAGRAVAAAARRAWALERGVKLFALAVILFLLGLACAFADMPGFAAVLGALAALAWIAVILTPSPLQRRVGAGPPGTRGGRVEEPSGPPPGARPR